jgi:hypothetical protein
MNSDAYSRTIVCVGEHNRLGVRKRLLPCLPTPVRMASIPCADGFHPPINPILTAVRDYLNKRKGLFETNKNVGK